MRTIFCFLAVSAFAFGILAATVTESAAQQSSSRSSSSSNRSSSSSSGGGSMVGSVSSFSIDGSSGSSSSNNNGGFIGSSNTGDFIGSSGSSTGSTANRGTSTRGTSSASRSRNTASRAGGRTNQGTGGNRSINQNTQVQPVYTLGFTAPVRDSAAVSTSLSNRFNGNLRTGRLGTIQVNVTNGVAVVGGSVGTDYDRKVIENMIRLQSGVTEISSEIQVQNSAAPSEFAPSIRRSRENVEIIQTTTPQGQPLVHVFQ